MVGVSPILVIVAYFSFLKYFVHAMDHESMVLISISSIMLFLALFILFVAMYAKLLSQSIESKYNYEYAVNVKSLLTDLKEFKHDFNNMLNGFKGCLLKGDIEEIKKYFMDWEESFMPANINFYNLGYIQNPAIFGVFLQKLDAFKNMRTKINILHDVSFDTIIDITSLCRIIGIVLDNAIEASIVSKDKRLTISILEDSSFTTVIVKNTFDGDINLNNIYNSSKGEGRGTGLRSMDRVLSKYKKVAHSFFIDESQYVYPTICNPKKKVVYVKSIYR